MAKTGGRIALFVLVKISCFKSRALPWKLANMRRLGLLRTHCGAVCAASSLLRNRCAMSRELVPPALQDRAFSDSDDDVPLAARAAGKA